MDTFLRTLVIPSSTILATAYILLVSQNVSPSKPFKRSPKKENEFQTWRQTVKRPHWCMVNGIRILACFWLASAGGCVPMLGDRSIAYKIGHVLYDPGKPAWKQAQRSEFPGQYYISEYVRDGDDINHWKELFTIQSFLPSWNAPTPDGAYNRLKTTRDKECPGMIAWNVIGQDATSVLYEWQAQPCLGWPHLHEIGQIIYGERTRVRIAYTVKMYQMPSENRTGWITKFTERFHER